MISETIKLLNSKPYYRTSVEVEVAKGSYHLKNFRKKLKRLIKK